MAVFVEMIEILPSSFIPHLWLGTLNSYLENTDIALHHFSTVVSLEPGSAFASESLVVSLLKLRKWKEALSEVHRFRNFYQSNPTVYNAITLLKQQTLRNYLELAEDLVATDCSGDKELREQVLDSFARTPRLDEV